MTISVIALIFNVSVFIYQAYTIFGKKRNLQAGVSHRQPALPQVYLESIVVPEGQREAALANLEEFGYVAAWDEKGRVKNHGGAPVTLTTFAPPHDTGNRGGAPFNPRRIPWASYIKHPTL